MTKITTSSKRLTDQPKKYIRLILTDDAKTFHRLVETKNGTLEYCMGTGDRKKVTPRQFRILIRSIVQAAKSHQIERLAVSFEFAQFPKLGEHKEEWFYSTILENLMLAAYDFRAYKTETKKDEKELKEIVLCGKLSAAAKKGIDRGRVIGEYVNRSRDIANTSGDDMSPGAFAAAAKNIAKGTKVQVTIFDEKGIKKEGFHALWAVGKGADDLPRFIVMEYWGAGKPGKNNKDKKKQPIVLVGKGVTYDTGGLNVKPSGAMHEMHMDMSGGAAMMASITAAAKLGVKKNIVALIPAAENAVSEKSMRAGDIINSHSGKTIEVLHTDAEGRLIMADALSYAKRYDPRVILDAATLTGAAAVALGQHASAILSKDEKLTAFVQKLGEESGDYVWPLPLWDEYQAPLLKTRADIVNIHPQFTRYAGTIEAASFLAYFAPKNVPWLHIDIAPRMESIPENKLAKGSTGEPVHLLVSFLEQY